MLLTFVMTVILDKMLQENLGSHVVCMLENDGDDDDDGRI